jgi:hypothetical protein
VTSESSEAASSPANTEVHSTISINNARFNTAVTTHDLDPRNTADTKYHVVTVGGFTSVGYAQ